MRKEHCSTTNGRLAVLPHGLQRVHSQRVCHSQPQLYSEMRVGVGRAKAYPPVGLAASEDDDALRARLAFRDVADLRVTNSNKLL